MKDAARKEIMHKLAECNEKLLALFKTAYPNKWTPDNSTYHLFDENPKFPAFLKANPPDTKDRNDYCLDDKSDGSVVGTLKPTIEDSSNLIGCMYDFAYGVKIAIERDYGAFAFIGRREFAKVIMASLGAIQSRYARGGDPRDVFEVVNETQFNANQLLSDTLSIVLSKAKEAELPGQVVDRCGLLNTQLIKANQQFQPLAAEASSSPLSMRR